jgi:hypothetical protein
MNFLTWYRESDAERRKALEIFESSQPCAG